MKALNLALRFCLELLAWILPAMWVYSLFEGFLAWVLAFGSSLALMTLWGVFAVPNDPSRSGKAPIIVSGKLRLGLEFFEFGLAVIASYFLYGSFWAGLLAVLVLMHHLLYLERMRWILQH